MPPHLNLRVLAGRLAVCRLSPTAAVPDCAGASDPFLSITRTPAELSVVCPESAAPGDAQCERGWRAIEVAGPLDFSLTGILAAIAQPLAEAGVSIFAVSTYDTDYVLVREEKLEQAILALAAAGHVVGR